MVTKWLQMHIGYTQSSANKAGCCQQKGSFDKNKKVGILSSWPNRIYRIIAYFEFKFSLCYKFGSLQLVRGDGKSQELSHKIQSLKREAFGIKGGIDPAEMLERFGAALKSLRRAKQENQKSIIVLIMQGVSLTSKAKEEIDKSRSIIDYFFTIEDVIEREEIREHLFKILKI